MGKKMELATLEEARAADCDGDVVRAIELYVSWLTSWSEFAPTETSSEAAMDLSGCYAVCTDFGFTENKGIPGWLTDCGALLALGAMDWASRYRPLDDVVEFWREIVASNWLGLGQRWGRLAEVFPESPFVRFGCILAGIQPSDSVIFDQIESHLDQQPSTQRNSYLRSLLAGVRKRR